MMAIEFVLFSTYFTFMNKIYKQIFGTPMGSPLSPIVADLIMRDLEEHVLNSLNIRPTCRYVDDIVLAAPKEEIHSILNKFSGYHHRLKFTGHKVHLKLDQSKHSVISEHITKYSFWENTKIMDHESRYFKRIISEMIHIKEQKVSLNLYSDTELLDETYSDILNELTSH